MLFMEDMEKHDNRDELLRNTIIRDIARRLDEFVPHVYDSRPVSPTGLSGDHILNPTMRVSFDATTVKPAAVLMPVLDRDEPTLLFTTRSTQLKHHSGQVSFPGGRREQGETACQTALREAREEVGIPDTMVTPLGYLDQYLSGTNYLITPVIGVVDPDFLPRPNPDEVADIFEAPLGIFLDEKNYQQHSTVLAGQRRFFYAIPYGSHFIWGVTAGILHNFCLRMERR